MKNNLSDKLFSSFNYKTNKNIFNLSIASSYTIFNIGLFLDCYKALLPVELLSFIISFYLLINSDKKYLSKDILDIKKLYSEFLSNYNKLNTTFELSNPVEIFTMFNYLYENGYLSKDKTFQVNEDNVCDIPPVMGVNVLAGNGVCRHISTLFTDILNDYGISANNMGCHMDIPVFDMKKVSKEEFSIDRVLNILEIVSKEIPEQYEELCYTFEMMYANGEYIDMSFVSAESEKIKRKANHLITLAYKDDINYFLDPTRKRIYRLDDKVLYDNFGLPIKIDNSFVGKQFGYKVMKDIYDGSNITKDEENKLINDTRKICENNLDIFENFYNENSDLYTDITNKLIRIKK